jgi:hypothetical protein
MSTSDVIFQTCRQNGDGPRPTDFDVLLSSDATVGGAGNVAFVTVDASSIGVDNGHMIHLQNIYPSTSSGLQQEQQR